MGMVPGLLFVLTEPLDPALSDAQFNDWYSNKHVVDTVNFGLAALAVRYRNINGSHKWPYLALYRLPDLLKVYDKKFMSSLPTDSPKGWGAPSSKADVRFKPQGYQLLKTFEGENARAGTSKFVQTAEVQNSSMNAKSFVAFCEESQFDDIDKEQGYRRSMLYQAGLSLVPQEGKAGTDFESVEQRQPTYLVVHEFDQMPSNRVWQQRDMGLWEYISEYGTGLYRTEPVPVKLYN